MLIEPDDSEVGGEGAPGAQPSLPQALPARGSGPSRENGRRAPERAEPFAVQGREDRRKDRAPAGSPFWGAPPIPGVGLRVGWEGSYADPSMCLERKEERSTAAPESAQKERSWTLQENELCKRLKAFKRLQEFIAGIFSSKTPPCNFSWLACKVKIGAYNINARDGLMCVLKITGIIIISIISSYAVFPSQTESVFSA